MEITKRTVAGATIFDLSGAIDAAKDEHYFASALANAASPVVLNFAGVESLDRAAIGMIISGCNYFISQRNGRIVLAELNKDLDPLARDLFQRMLRTYSTEDDALASLRQ